jgi:hypothetical protein
MGILGENLYSMAGVKPTSELTSIDKPLTKVPLPLLGLI